MAKKIQLTIPEPCQENWDKMTPVDKGRFCGSCQKQVVDFSNMSDREVAHFFKKPSTGSVCGRFMQDQLNRDIEIPKKRLPWVKYFFQITLPAFLFSYRAKAQGSVVLFKAQKCDVPIIVRGQVLAEEKKENPTDTIMVSGKITDVNGTPLPYASVVIKGTKEGVVANEKGIFTIKPGTKWEKITLVFSYVGYSVVEVKVENKNPFANVALEPVVMGEMIVGLIITKPERNNKKAKPIPIVTKNKDTVANTFKIYPNPVLSGSNVTLEWKEKEEGYYIAQLVNQSGQVIFTKEIWIDAEARVLNLDLPTVTAGSYFIRVTNKKSGKNSAEKIIIQ
jgi:hypothetical protein